MIKFTANYDDLSTDRGYQFKFHCDKCGNGYMSRFQPSLTGTAGGLLRAAGDLFGGVFSNAGNSAYEIQRATGGKAHDTALEIVTDMGRASTSVLQRRLSIGYGRAAKILDMMERRGFIGPSEGASKPRKVLQTAYDFRERLGQILEEEVE